MTSLEGVFLLVDLGIVSIDPDSTRWQFRPLAKSTVAGDEIDVDCLFLFPTEVTYIELSGRPQLEAPSVLSVADEFDQSALTARRRGARELMRRENTVGVWRAG